MSARPFVSVLRTGMFAACALTLVPGCDPAAADIAKAIGSDNPVMREDGAKIAQNYTDDVVVQALIKVLADPAVQVRLNAIESISEINATAAVPTLITLLNTDPDTKVKRAAADSLGRLKAKEAVGDLVVYVNGFQPDDHEQLAGVWALGNIGSQGLEADSKKLALTTLVARRDAAKDKFVKYVAAAALRTLK
jgi:HEAT repeat protein